MRRREFITLIGSAAAAWPLAVRAQQAASRRHIGVLLVGFSPDSKEVRQFRRGLRDAGYSEGRDVVIEWRSANGGYDRVPELIADLVRKQVDVIVIDSTVGTEVAERVTSTIPIVMALVVDPVGSGLVDSLAHPGGNVTGLSMMTTELNSRRLQLLKELTSRAFSKFESYGMLETAASRGWKAKDATEWFYGIGRLGPSQARIPPGRPETAGYSAGAGGAF